MKNAFSCFSSCLRVGACFRTGLLPALLLFGQYAMAQVTLSSGSIAYSTTAAGTTINVSGSYSGSITIGHANCTLNFNSVSYGGAFTVNGGGAGSTINNNPGSTITGSSNVISAVVAINNLAAWSGNFYSGIASGSTVNNTGIWGSSGVQFSPLNGLTIANSGTWNAVAFAASGTTLTNSGTWNAGLGNLANFTLVNAAGATWSQPLSGSGGSLTVTNNGTFTANVTFPMGTNTFTNRAGATATLGSVAFGGTTTVTNGLNGGTPTLTFTSSPTVSAGTTVINYAGTVNTNAGLNNLGSIDNRATWNASSYTNNGGGTTNSGTMSVTNSYSNSGGTTTNAATGIITASTYSNTGGTTTNNNRVTLSGAFTNSGGNVNNNAGATLAMTNFSTSNGTTTNAGTLNPTGNFTNGTGAGSFVVVTSAINPVGNYLNGGTTTNNGTISPGGYYDNQNSGATTTNNGTIAPGTYFSNKATTTNNGTIAPGTYFESLSSGSTTNNSSGRITPGTNFTSSGAFNNNRGRITLASTTSTFLNTSTFTNAGPISAAGAFTNNAAFNGAASAPAGSVRVNGVSTNTSTFGSSGLLDFCDTTPGAPANKGFNVQSGTVAATVTTCLAPLPVTLTRFAAAVIGGRVELSWATASEKNNAYFAVERSTDGQQFGAIAEVRGRGNASGPATYAATDAAPAPGLSYYRLRQVDTDGTFAFSPVATVTTVAKSLIAWQVVPNPATDYVLLTLPGVAGGQVEVFDLRGQRWLSQPLTADDAPRLDVRALPPGVYLLRVSATGQPTTTRRLLKK